MHSFHKISIILLAVLYFSSCGCGHAESRSVPGNFNYRQFESIIRYASANYLDPSSVNKTACYEGAAEAALRSLPYPLILYPKSFYDKRKEIQGDRMLPGKVVDSSDARFVIFEPDYVALEKQNQAYEKKEKERRKTMNAQEKNNYTEELRKKLKDEQKIIDDAWQASKFTSKDFQHIIAWIETHITKYSKLPPNYKGEDPYEKEPFGLNHVFFSATNGYLMAMDPHSSVIEAEQWNKARRESEDSSFEGIGALLRGGGSQDTVVETPYPDTPALNAGVRAGDIIKKVDGKSVENLSLNDVVKRIRGPRDTVVTLSIQRAAETSLIDIPIKRGVIVQKAVSSKYIKDNHAGVIKLSSFLYSEHAPSDLVREEYDKLIKESAGKMKGLVLDMRGNPGGDLNEAVNVAGLFLPVDAIVVRINGRGEQVVRRNEMEPLKVKVPLIVLINAQSASASEIVASALQDHNAALILGERSFGKASVQELRGTNEYYIKLTKSRYYAPDGYTVQVRGVEPDIQVSEEEDKTFPFRFREEDMWKHLPELEKREIPPKRAKWVKELEQIVGNNQAAESYLVKHKPDAVKPDYMLTRALSYFNALQKYPKP